MGTAAAGDVEEMVAMAVTGDKQVGVQDERTGRLLVRSQTDCLSNSLMP